MKWCLVLCALALNVLVSAGLVAVSIDAVAVGREFVMLATLLLTLNAAAGIAHLWSDDR